MSAGNSGSRTGTSWIGSRGVAAGGSTVVPAVDRPPEQHDKPDAGGADEGNPLRPAMCGDDPRAGEQRHSHDRKTASSSGIPHRYLVPPTLKVFDGTDLWTAQLRDVVNV